MNPNVQTNKSYLLQSKQALFQRENFAKFKLQKRQHGKKKEEKKQKANPSK